MNYKRITKFAEGNPTALEGYSTEHEDYSEVLCIVSTQSPTDAHKDTTEVH